MSTFSFFFFSVLIRSVLGVCISFRRSFKRLRLFMLWIWCSGARCCTCLLINFCNVFCLFSGPGGILLGTGSGAPVRSQDPGGAAERLPGVHLSPGGRLQARRADHVAHPRPDHHVSNHLICVIKAYCRAVYIRNTAALIFSHLIYFVIFVSICNLQDESAAHHIV